MFQQQQSSSVRLFQVGALISITISGLACLVWYILGSIYLNATQQFFQEDFRQIEEGQNVAYYKSISANIFAALVCFINSVVLAKQIQKNSRNLKYTLKFQMVLIIGLLITTTIFCLQDKLKWMREYSEGKHQKKQSSFCLGQYDNRQKQCKDMFEQFKLFNSYIISGQCILQFTFWTGFIFTQQILKAKQCDTALNYNKNIQTGQRNNQQEENNNGQHIEEDASQINLENQDFFSNKGNNQRKRIGIQKNQKKNLNQNTANTQIAENFAGNESFLNDSVQDELFQNERSQQKKLN